MSQPSYEAKQSAERIKIFQIRISLINRFISEKEQEIAKQKTIGQETMMEKELAVLKTMLKEVKGQLVVENLRWGSRK